MMKEHLERTAFRALLRGWPLKEADCEAHKRIYANKTSDLARSHPKLWTRARRHDCYDIALFYDDAHLGWHRR